MYKQTFKLEAHKSLESVMVGGFCMMSKISLSTPMVTLLGCRTNLPKQLENKYMKLQRRIIHNNK